MRDVIKRGPKTPRDTSLFIKYTLASIGIPPSELENMRTTDVLDLFYLHVNIKQMEAEALSKVGS